MKCSACGYENREGAKFCEDCGTQLSWVCPKCGQQLGSQAKFCGFCGNKLTADAESERYKFSVEAERKRITVLLFGIPKIHEDDPLRAITPGIRI